MDRWLRRKDVFTIVNGPVQAQGCGYGEQKWMEYKKCPISTSEVTRQGTIYLFVYASLHAFAGYLADCFGGDRVILAVAYRLNFYMRR